DRSVSASLPDHEHPAAGQEVDRAFGDRSLSGIHNDPYTLQEGGPCQLKEVQRLMVPQLDNVERVIVGKRESIEFIMVALLCEGHVLLEDVPGSGKTMLARSVALSLGISFKRIQCTPDLLPNDITGVSIFNQKEGEFEFKPGPI